MQAAWVKVAGGLYLLYLAGQHFLGQGDADDTPTTTAKAFWRTILTIELADIAFSTDSILASIAVSDRLWVVVTGGILGITMMRLAAILFIRLIELFPNLERTAYLLVSTVGLKLLIESFHFQGVDFSSSSHPAFWALWGTMVVCVMTGFIPQKQAVVNT
jgi:YkoY family integral membrane protein